MTHRENRTPIDRVLTCWLKRALMEWPQAIATLMNEAMKLERSDFLGADPHERTSQRRGHANGYKPKHVKTRVGELALQVPQVRDVEDGEGFYPQSLEKGQRSERALRLAVAEMYVQGVSTRRVAEITRELCGLDVSSTDVSRAAGLLDESSSSGGRGRWGASSTSCSTPATRKSVTADPCATVPCCRPSGSTSTASARCWARA